MMKCPVCEGSRGWRVNLVEGVSHFEGCPYCNETGKISFMKWARYYFWSYMPDWTWDVAYWIHENKMKRSK